MGEAAQSAAAGSRDAVDLVSVGRAIPYSKVRICADDDRELPQGTVGHILIGGDNVTRNYFEDPEANAAAFTADGWLRTGDLGLFHQGEIYISGRAKEIIFVNGQNYYPHDIESIAQHADGLELGKVVAAGVRPADSQTEELVVFILHRGGMEDFLPLATRVTRLINEQTGLEVGAVVPVKRIPKTTSGKIQRHLLEQSFLDGEFAAELKELEALRAAERGGAPETGSLTEIEDKLKTICDTAMQGKRIGVNDNLFEVGASSLKLIEIHERIDHEYPGLIDLTELFDFPTIGELARTCKPNWRRRTSSSGVSLRCTLFLRFWRSPAAPCSPPRWAAMRCLGKSLNDPYIPAAANMVVGIVLTAALLLIVHKPLPVAAVARSAPWWTWIAGGLLGTVYLTANVLLAPKLGAASLVGFVVTGQLLFAVVADQFGWLGFAQHPASIWRYLGCLLMMAGVALIARF